MMGMMRWGLRFSALFLLLVLLVAGVGCRSVHKAPAEGELPKGRTVVITDSLFSTLATDTLRLGRLRSGEQLQFRFQLRNQSSKPQVILGHEITCGCIALSYENKPIMPNTYLPVELLFDSRGLYGWQLKLFRLRFHQAEQPLLLYVEAEVE
uniref:DUF1573 domain-containing protein n=1 Tax=Alistipes sp. TaxID=1872444 RepID=UPI0040577372